MFILSKFNLINPRSCIWKQVDSKIIGYFFIHNTMVVVVQLLNCVWLLSRYGLLSCQAPLSMGFSRQEYWRGLPFPSSGDLPDPWSNPHLLHCRQILIHNPISIFFRVSNSCLKCCFFYKRKQEASLQQSRDKQYSSWLRETGIIEIALSPLSED